VVNLILPKTVFYQFLTFYIFHQPNMAIHQSIQTIRH
jgi:hypothetical protein